MGEIIISKDNSVIDRRQLSDAPITIGSDNECELVLNDNGVCQKQVQVFEKEGKAILQSLAACWMTLVNGSPSQEVQQLNNGDCIQIGPYNIKFDNVSHIEEEMEASGAFSQDFDSLIEDEEDEESDHPAEIAEGEVAIGEFIEPDTSDDIDMIGAAEGCEEMPVPDGLRKVIDKRLKILAELEHMDEERKAILESEGLPEAAGAELRRQMREVQLMPSGEKAQEQLDKLQQKLTQQEEKVKSGEGQEFPLEYQNALQMAIKQWRLLIEREMLIKGIVEQALPLAKQEPLFSLLAVGRINSSLLFGWAHYALALETEGSQNTLNIKALRASAAKFDNKKGGLFGKFRSLPPEELAEKEKIEAMLKECIKKSARIGRELSGLEQTMINEFWKIYEQAALLLVQTNIPESEEKLLRAFLRYGLLGVRPWFLPKETARHLLTDCGDIIRSWDHSTKGTYSIYADEYIYFTAHGHITPSLDEDLELNNRNSPAWKADKAWRRIVHSRSAEFGLRETEAVLQAQIDRLRKEQEHLTTLKEKLIHGALDFKKKNSEYSQKIQRCRVEAARLERVVDKIEEKYLPKLISTRDDAKAKLDECEYKLTRKEIVLREVNSIHRVSRLCANLKEKFAPFSLRDHYKLDTDAINPRKDMLGEMALIEKLDPTIFKDQLFPVKKKAHRIYIRQSPIMLITPCCGFLGYSWNPRYGAEIGRLVVPAYMPRPRLREKMLHNIFSDFRWDTSKASAGVDLMTSETIVAAFAQVRWEYRKRSKEKREKAAIFNDENDRKNWRRHYALYISSALEGGKRLFFKNIESYEQVILKYFDLPEGVERLRR